MVNRIWPTAVAGKADSVSSVSASASHIGGPNSVSPGQILLVYGNLIYTFSHNLLRAPFQIYFAQGRSYYGSPDEFSSMGDVDWGKRGGISSIMGKRNVGAVMRSYRSPSYKRYDSPG